MPIDSPSPLSAWNDFYVIVGSAGAALTGLQFVVVALAADRKTITPAGAGAFATPTIFHFCAVLVVSAVASAPWRQLTGAAAFIGACGAAGLAYSTVILRRARRQKDYEPVLEDWIWHFAAPILSYGGLLAAALMLTHRPGPALFTVAFWEIVLLLTGIHNAWDSAIYIAVENQPASQFPKKPE